MPKQAWDRFSITRENRGRVTLDLFFCFVFTENQERMHTGVALSYSSLNTYQNQLVLRNNSKQVVFLMAHIMDACHSAFPLNMKQKDSS